MKFYKIIFMLIVFVTVGCGSGGSSTTSSSSTSSSGAGFTIGTQMSAGTFNYYAVTNSRAVVRYLYPVDLNGDGLEEIIFAGFETQPNTAADYTNTTVHIFGWNNQQLVEITSQWLPGTANQVEGVADVTFGDFDNDGNLDVFLTGYSDMDHPLNAFALMSNGSSFTKVTLGTTTWEHGATSKDINNDGYDDVFVAGGVNPSYFYLGGPSGLTRHANPDHIRNTSGSGIAIDDFLGNGQQTILVSDRSGEAPADTVLYTTTLDSNGVVTDYVKHSTLPAPRIETLHATLDSHDIRVRSFDFSNDGLPDAVVFSRPWNIPGGSSWTELSEIQFLENNGNGSFTDVTDTRLVNYHNDSGVSYTPVFQDFNGDGLTDIFVSEATFSSTHDSTAFLIQTTSGTFVDTGRTELSALVNPSGGLATMVKGPNGDFYFVTEESLVVSGNLNTEVKYARVTWP